ncbi:MAG: small basic family protein [Clostridiales bacterium]|jgi:small basic protein|nr:small basic family protein [Clostridiales bacterium]
MLFFVGAIVIGVLLGIFMPIHISSVYSLYVAIAILAGLDSVFGGMVAYIKDKFNLTIFITGFFGNALLAAAITYLGKILGVDLYLAAIFVFGTRLFSNFAFLRRTMIEFWERKR